MKWWQMSKELAKKYIIGLGVISSVVTFMGTLYSDGIKAAIGMTILVAFIFAAVGYAGLKMFWGKDA